MPEVDIRNWAEVATGEPALAWQQVQGQLHDLGLGNAYFVFDYPLFTSGFPADDRLIGTVVSEEWNV